MSTELFLSIVHLTSMKVLFDTDIGTNIDDALALAYLLKNPQCELLGITTVTGDGQRRASIAAGMCEAAGMAVPVHQGSELPLVKNQSQGTVSGRSPQQAIEYLRSTIRSHPGEISLLTTGPLTNIALLFLLDPEIPTLLDSMVSMAGVYYPAGKNQRNRETNITLDPHAAARVLSTRGVGISLVGLDVTLECRKTRAQMGPILSQVHFPLLQSMIEEWLEETGALYFHDPLAAAVLFNADICTWQKGVVRVQTESGECYFDTGQAKKGKDPAHLVANRVDVSRFFDHYFRIITDSYRF